MDAIELLNQYKLKRTRCREGIVEVILSSQNALSENEIQERLTGNYDRTTFYRSFKTLVEYSIIRKIVVDNQLVKYELDSSLSSKKEHAHFYCNQCKEVKCLDAIEVPNTHMPKGFTVAEKELVLKGVCDLCSEEG